jgi:hypothetical protein
MPTEALSTAELPAALCEVAALFWRSAALLDWTYQYRIVVTKIHEEIICHMEEMDELQVKLGEATTNN